MSIKKLPTSERPYEKLEMYGESALSNAELLAIIIKSGTKEESSVTLAQKILSLKEEKNCMQDSLAFLQEISMDDLTKIRGIGKVKAIQIKAVCELAKRIAKPIEVSKIKIGSPEDIVKILMGEMQDEKREIVKVIILNSRNVIIKIQTISLGDDNSAIIKPKDVLFEAIKMGSHKIILVHNHPSGDATPSQKDYDFTMRLEQSAEMLDIQLLDHIVIGYNEYTSIKRPHIKGKEDKSP